MRLRNTVCLAVLLYAVDLHVTSGRHVSEDVVDDVVNDVTDELDAPTEVVDTEVSENSSASNHLLLSREKRKAIKYLQYRWKQNEIPFEIDYSKFNSTHVYEIFKGMNEWQTYTCLRFRPRKQQDQNYVTFEHHESKCQAVIGMSHAGQTIGLAYYCFNSHTILHEIGHAIGFYHEQSRPDRDQYITVSKNVANDYSL
ncbi:unnamed protein product [Candidula unifasciata]|uniref:Metalloendopeptidase n=1 Tax=Candidula unifasciata TaxID=100452 RepID=A0A8S4AEF8_9EUPU|nr:unnamed protein product [Candidula unifasciata]